MSFTVTLQTAVDQLTQLENNPPHTPQEIRQASKVFKQLAHSYFNGPPKLLSLHRAT